MLGRFEKILKKFFEINKNRLAGARRFGSMEKLFFSVPAVGAEVFLVNARGVEHIVKTEVCKGGEMQFFADLFNHLLVFFAVGINVFFDDFGGRLLALQLRDNTSGDQFHFGGGAGEVQILTAVQDGGTARADVYFFCTAVIEELCGFSELCTANDGVVDEEQLFAVDELVDRDQLHFCDQIAFFLMSGREGAGPGRRILNERSGEFHVGFVGVADGMCDTGVGDACDEVGLNDAFVSFCEALAAVVAHFFDGDSFIRGGRIAVVNPKEGTDLHGVVRREERVDAVFVHDDDLTGCECLVIRITEIEVSEAFEADAEAVFLFADDNGCSAVFITNGINTLAGQDEHAHGAVNDLLRIADAFDEIFFLVDDRGNKLGLVDFAVLHFEEMGVIFENSFYNFFGIIDFSDRCNTEGAVMRTDEDRLCFIVGNATDTVFAEHFVGFLFEFGSEGCIFNIVDGFVEAVFLAVNSHARTAGSEVRVIVYTVK